MTSLTARVAGILRAPRSTYAALADRSRAPVADVLALTTLVQFVALAALFSTQVGRVALVDQWERTALAFGRVVDDAAYARLQALSFNGVAYAVLLAVLLGPVLAAAIAGMLRLVVRDHSGQTLSFAQLLSVTAHASVVLALRQLVSTPINYVTETLASPTTLGRFVSGFDETSALARFAGTVDLFLVWWVIVLATGVSVVAHRPAKRLALTLTAVYVAVALLLALGMVATGGQL